MRKDEPTPPCPTGKYPYPTEHQAKVALRTAQQSRLTRAGRRRRHECRYYRCPECGRWHLTSKRFKEAT